MIFVDITAAGRAPNQNPLLLPFKDVDMVIHSQTQTMVQQEFRFEGKNHTEGNIMTTYLSAMPQVTFAGYSMDDDNTQLTLCINADDPQNALAEACARACAEFGALHRALNAGS